MDITINQTTQKWVISPQGDLVLTSGLQAVAQFVGQRIKTFLGEWFLDTTIGVPYYQEILKKNPNPVTIEAVIKSEIINSPGILELTDFSLDYDTSSRKLNISFTATSQFGEVVFDESIGV